MLPQGYLLGHSMLLDGKVRSGPVLLPHFSKMGLLLGHYNEDLPLLQDTARLAEASMMEGIGNKAVGSSRPRHHHNVLGNHLVCKMCVVPEVVIDKV